MPNDALDLAFARHVRQIGLITAEQVNAALQTQSKCLQQGKTISVGDAMVDLGLLTATQKEALEKKVKDQQAGVQQLGPYKLMKKLGEGGMGAVYLALDPTTQAHVAVKVLPRAMGANAEFVKRFRREAEAATQLKHPNIVGAFATGEDLGYHYYVMEYCEGQALDAVLAAEKKLPVERAVDIVLQSAQGLKYAHDQGIIHRDIKPSNIIVAQDGTAKILDLGLSKNLEDTKSFKTVTGAVLGTPHYISPEQAQGEKNVDGRSDIYSLGATLYHLLTGKVPFDGATALEILSKHVNTVLPNPQDLREDIPDPVVEVLQRMMAKEPADRYRDCGALITDLVEVSMGRTPKTHVISAALTTIAPSKKSVLLKKRPPTIRRTAAGAGNKTPMIVGIGVAVAVVVVLIVAFSGGSDPVPTPPAPIARPQPPPKEAEPPKAAFDLATWEKSLAGAPIETQLKAVLSRLKDLNPGYDGSERHESGHGGVLRLELSHVALRDVTPLRALTTLSQLDFQGTSVGDLAPLKDSPVRSLTCAGMKSLDLRSIRGIKQLKFLSLKSTPVKDLSPLAGMDLWQLNLKGTSASDLSPLRQVKLRELLCDFDAKRDTDLLKSMPDLEKINDLPVEEFWRKEKGPDAPAPVGPEEQLRIVLGKLKHLNPDHDGRALPLLEEGAVVELTLNAMGLSDLSPLKELKGLRRLDVSGYWDSAEKREYKSGFADLGPLRGLKLETLRVHHTSVADLEPLRGMKLEWLDILSTNVRDLSPIKGMPLKKLEFSYTKVSDLSPIVGLPLNELRFNNTDVTDLSLIKTLTIHTLVSDLLHPQKHRALLLSMPTLQWINSVSAADFLKSGDKPAPTPPQPQPPAPAKPTPEELSWKNAIDLLALIEPARDSVRGNWKREGSRIISEFGENGVLRIPYEPPPEYDFKIVFTRARGSCAVAQFLQRDGRAFFWEMAGWGNVNSGFAVVNGKGSKENPTNSGFVPRDGVRYTSVIQVRRDRVTALLDDKKISEWLPAMGEFTTDSNWCVDVPNLLGIGNCESLTTFDLIQIREVTGKGRVRKTLATPIDAGFLRIVASVPPAEQVKKVAEKLRELNPAYDGEYKHRVEGNAVVEFEVSTHRIFDGWPIRALAFLKKLDLEGDNSVMTDIGFLRGLRLQELGLSRTRVYDLSPLVGMPLTSLQISGTPVRDLLPLTKLPLQRLECDRIPATDLLPLKAIRSLKTINDQPAAEFLKGQKDSWNILFDGKSLDAFRKNAAWQIERGAIVNDPGTVDSLQTKLEFENADIRIRFEVQDVEGLGFNARQGDRGGYGLFFGKSQLDQMRGKPHELMFTLRGDVVTAALDGKPLNLSEVKAVKSGCLQISAAKGTLRVTAIEYRPLP